MDTVYCNGTFLTTTGSRKSADAIWVQDEIIAGIGSTGELSRAAGAGAHLVDLGGATVVPGFIDAHCHVTALAYLADAVDCSPSAANDSAAVLSALASADARGDGWVSGAGYHGGRSGQSEPITRADLDGAVTERPCVLYHRSLHACVLNSAGLASLGLKSDAAEPAGGRLGRSPSGELDGWLYERPMFELFSANLARLLAELSDGELVRLYRAAMRRLASVGITSCTDANVDPVELSALHRADAAGAIEIPVRVLLSGTNPDWSIRVLRGLGEWHGSPANKVSLGGVKLFADGGLSSRTAAMTTPYVGTASDCGMLLMAPAQLRALYRRYEDASVQVAVHAQGDAAIGLVLDAAEDAIRAGNPLRHRIEHGGLFEQHLRTRAARLGMLVVTQPGFISALGDEFITALGVERSSRLLPIRSLRDAGILVAGSSDAPVADPSPLRAIRDAMLRRSDGGAGVGPTEAIGLMDALSLYGSEAAHASFATSNTGEIAVGKRADFVVLGADPRLVAPEALPTIGIRLTVSGGVAVYRDIPVQKATT